ncbi:MAG: hypothetical protein KTR26_01505 [Flammeovirgaceae bacterium]|nr:hypothetical protein [Flammeovirgaceae bacterium]
MFSRFFEKWYGITYFGVSSKMPYSLQKKTLLCNKLALLAMVLAFASLPIIATFQLKGGKTMVVLFIIALGLATIPHFNKMGKVNFTRLVMSIASPIFILGYTIVDKYKSPGSVEVIDYFAPRALIFLTILIPLVLLDFKHSFQMVIGLISNVVCLLFFDYLHKMFSVDYATLISQPSQGYFMINGFYLIAIIAVIMAFYFYQRTNDHFEGENQALIVAVRKSNADLIEKQKKLEEAYQELKTIDEEIRQNSEELQAINENLIRTRDELKISFNREKESNEKLALAHKELKEAQMQVIQSEKMASLGQLTAGVAHEINNPINFVYAGVSTLKSILESFMEVVSNYEELDSKTTSNHVIEKIHEIKALKEELEYDELKIDLKEIVNDINEGATRTAEIVKGLRNFSRLDEEHLKIADINECINSTLVILGSQFRGQIEIFKNFDEHLPIINCYPGQLNQVFLNILNNAAQAIEGKGEIYITTKNLPDMIQVRIKDTGSGIPTHIKDKIFEPFYTTKEVGEGTGLGLSISYGIIEKHKGKIMVESEVGQGTEFIINLSKNIQVEENGVNI